MFKFCLLWAMTTSVYAHEPILPITSTRSFLIHFLSKKSFESSGSYQRMSDELLVQSFIDQMSRPAQNGRARKSLWFTDLDDTLIQPQHLFTSIRFRRTHLDQTRKQIQRDNPGVSQERLNELLALDFWQFARLHPGVREVDPLYTRLLQRFQREVGTVIALTARPREMADVTKRQLDDLGLTFPLPGGCVDLTEGLPVTGIPGVVFSERNFASDRSTKGKTIAEVTRSIKRCLPPGEELGDVFFVDDRSNEVEAVMSMKAEIEQLLSQGSLLQVIYSQVVRSRLEHLGHLSWIAEIGRLQEQVLATEGVLLPDDEAFRRLRCHELLR